MRLSQLARQLNTDSSKIVAFLSKEGIEVENHPNTKLEDDQIKLAEEEFKVEEEVKPEEPAEIKSAEEKLAELSGAKEETTEAPSAEPQSEPQVVTKEEPVAAEESKEDAPISEEATEKESTETTDTPDEKPQEVPVPAKIDLEPTKEEDKPRVFKAELEKDPEVDDNAELIKAPKIELEGIKVVGKIELPEKPVEEKPEEEEIEEEVVAEEPIDPNAPKVHPSKLAKQKAEAAINAGTTYLPPTKDEDKGKKKQVQVQNEPGTKKKNRKSEKDYEPLWQKRQTYFSDKKEERAAAKAAKKRTWIGKFFHWWTTE